MKASPIQYAFNGGQLGPRLQGRSDLARYQTGCNKLQNFIPTYQGPALKRSGFRHVKPVKDSTKKTRLIPFEFSREQAYVLELGEGYLRIYRNSGTVLESSIAITSVAASNPVVVTGANSFSAGDQVYIADSVQTELNGRYFTVANPTAGNLQLSGEDGSGRTTGAGGTVSRVYEITDGVSSNSLPWLEAELFEISIAQSADVLYLAHPNHPPHKISRTANTAWTAEAISFSWPPMRDENLNASHKLVISQNTGTGRTITLTGTSDPLFTADTVGTHVTIREVVEATQPKWRAGVATFGGGGLDPRITGPSSFAGDLCYYDGKVYALNATPSGNTGSDAPVHDSTEDGAVADKAVDWNFYNRGAGYGKITAVAGDGLSCTVDVVVDFPYTASTVNPSKSSHGGTGFDASPTHRWAVGAWNAEYGYPQTVSFYEDRLWFASTQKDPQTFWGSRTGDYENFEVVIDEASSSLSFTLATDKVNAIEWMSGEDVLLMGTSGGEFTVDSGSAESGITPSNIRVRRRSNYGSASGLQPIFIDSALLFVQRAKARLHELVYAFETDRYRAPDLTQMSYDILNPGVVQMSYQASPLRLLWIVLSDGALSSLTYIADQEVIAWAKHVVGGASAKVESVATIPHPDGDEDQLWAITSRTVNGATVRHIEFLEKPFADDAVKEDAFFVDDGLTYDGASTTTITGLHHLEGETVNVLGDGVVMATSTVSGGSITLATAVTKAHVGLPMPAAQLQTMRLEAGGAKGTSQGRRKRVPQMVARVQNMGDGLKYGTTFDNMNEWTVRKTSDAMDTPVPLYTGDTTSLTMPGGWEREGRVAISHDLPLPATIVSLMPQVSTEER